MEREFKAFLCFGDIKRNHIGYTIKMSPRSNKYKKLWHVGDFYEDPKLGEIIICRYENQYIEFLRVDSGLNTDEIIEWAYLNDLI